MAKQQRIITSNVFLNRHGNGICSIVISNAFTGEVNKQ